MSKAGEQDLTLAAFVAEVWAPKAKRRLAPKTWERDICVYTITSCTSSAPTRSLRPTPKSWSSGRTISKKPASVLHVRVNPVALGQLHGDGRLPARGGAGCALAPHRATAGYRAALSGDEIVDRTKAETDRVALVLAPLASDLSVLR